MHRRHLLAGLAGGLALPALARAQYRVPALSAGGRPVEIVVETLHPALIMSPGVFASHDPAHRLWQEGQKASPGLKALAETGNTDPLMFETMLGIGNGFNSSTVMYPILPRQQQVAVVTVTEAAPLVSGALMIGQTDDGFIGVDSVDAHRLRGPEAIELFAMDAGTKRNTESKASLVALGGTGGEPEDAPIRRHPGYGQSPDVDPTWRFDPARPIARLMLRPLEDRAAR
ncbi:MAG TPA: spondin domain-containing protein [Crenalkalicoccus sp.]|jgi:hypothetical protein|nr:spondin domain-containing protein [Crenalkalicoccus sp.]